MKATKALSKVWDSLHTLESSLDEIDGDLNDVQRSKRTIERALMVLGRQSETHDEWSRVITRDTEL